MVKVVLKFENSELWLVVVLVVVQSCIADKQLIITSYLQLFIIVST
jgi:hypothetical protein